jgi:hypothetical protein
VNVIANQIKIDIPFEIPTPRGGCSRPRKLTLSNPPYSDLRIESATTDIQSGLITLNTKITKNVFSFSKTVFSPFRLDELLGLLQFLRLFGSAANNASR